MLSSLRRVPATAKGRSRALGPFPRLAARLATAAVAWLATFDGSGSATALPTATEPPASLPAAPIPGLPELGYDLERLQEDFDIPIEVNDRVLKHLREYQSPGSRRSFVRWIVSSHRYAERFREILQEQGVPGDLIFLAMVESGFRTHAESPAGAVGPWQFMASTGRELGLRTDRWVDERRDPEKSARAAARFLWLLHERMGDWHLAWAAYNAGPGRVARALRRGYSDFWHMEQQRALPVETRDYVAKIIAAAILTRHAEAFGLPVDELQPGTWVDYELVVIPRPRSLSRLAAAACVGIRELRDLNPELRRSVTPPRAYLLKIPRTSAAAFAENWPGIWARTPASPIRCAPHAPRLARDDGA